MSVEAPSDPSAPFLDALHADKPLRVWSLIVTIFGDVVMRQGRDLAPPPVWTGHLLALLDLLGVEPGLVRTSLSRLVSGGTLERGKSGRNTFYRLSSASARDFAAAAETIYGRKPRPPAEGFHVALIDRTPDRAGARAALEAQGFRFLFATTALKPARGGEPAPALPPKAIIARAGTDGEAAAAAREIWRIDALQGAYRDFASRFADPDPGPSPEAAIIARIVLVHRMRRLLLRDPALPVEALPEDWAGEAARALFMRHLAAIERPSEHWLELIGFRSAGGG